MMKPDVKYRVVPAYTLGDGISHCAHYVCGDGGVGGGWGGV